RSRELARFAEQVRRALAAYPDGMIERLDLRRVVLTRGVLDGKAMVAGHADTVRHEIAVRWDPHTDDETWAWYLHHEIGHFVDGPLLDNDPEWIAANAPGWRYTGDYRVYSDKLPQQKANAAPGI